jgi:hypothetical protein
MTPFFNKKFCINWKQNHRLLMSHKMIRYLSAWKQMLFGWTRITPLPLPIGWQCVHLVLNNNRLLTYPKHFSLTLNLIGIDHSTIGRGRGVMRVQPNNICFHADKNRIILCDINNRWFCFQFIQNFLLKNGVILLIVYFIIFGFSSSPVLSGVGVAKSLIFCVVFCRPLFVFFL